MSDAARQSCSRKNTINFEQSVSIRFKSGRYSVAARFLAYTLAKTRDVWYDMNTSSSRPLGEQRTGKERYCI